MLYMLAGFGPPDLEHEYEMKIDNACKFISWILVFLSILFLFTKYYYHSYFVRESMPDKANTMYFSSSVGPDMCWNLDQTTIQY